MKRRYSSSSQSQSQQSAMQIQESYTGKDDMMDVGIQQLSKQLQKTKLQPQRRRIKTQQHNMDSYTQYEIDNVEQDLKKIFLKQQQSVNKLRQKTSNNKIPYTFHELDTIMPDQDQQVYDDKIYGTYDPVFLEHAIHVISKLDRKNRESGIAFLEKILEKFFRLQPKSRKKWENNMKYLVHLMNNKKFPKTSIDKVMNTINELRNFPVR